MREHATFIKTPKRPALEKFFEEHYKWKAEKEKHRERTLQLRRDAQKEFYKEYKGWFKTLDNIGIVLIILNLLAIILTGLLVVKEEPGKSFVEGNPTQCVWNGWSCHDQGWKVFIPVIKQLGIWALLVMGYVFVRMHTFNSTGLLVLTAIIIIYTVFITWDTSNDLGLYLGKIFYGWKQ